MSATSPAAGRSRKRLKPLTFPDEWKVELTERSRDQVPTRSLEIGYKNSRKIGEGTYGQVGRTAAACMQPSLCWDEFAMCKRLRLCCVWRVINAAAPAPGFQVHRRGNRGDSGSKEDQHGQREGGLPNHCAARYVGIKPAQPPPQPLLTMP
jgi:hypothetical protein